MSELIAEARVLVTPDTTQFRRLLDAELTAATKKPVVVPVTPVVASGASTTKAVQQQVQQQVAQQVAGATAAQSLVERENAKFLAKRTTEESAASAKRIAQREKEVAALLAQESKLAADQQRLEAQRVTTGTAESSKRIAQREAEVRGLLAEEKKLAVQQQALEAQRVTSGTAEATKRIAQREAEVAGILAEERRLLLQEESFEAARVTAATKASSQRIAAREREVATLLAADRKAAASAVAASEAQAAAGAASLERQLGGLSKGGASAAASLLGVRGATLAATAPFIAGAAGAIAFGKAISIATSFNSQLAVFAATTGATADEMERVSEAAKQLGKDITLPGVSASDAAESMTEFAKAGLSVNDAIRATRGGLQLATAAQLSNADAVEITASALNAFKLQGTDAVHVADTLANAANAAQGSISDIALGLSQASGAAAAVGVSFEDTTALLSLLAKNGLTASDAGTALRTAFIRLVNPSKQAQKILRDLNINLRDAQGNLRPEVFKEFADAQKDLAVSTQQANSAVVFGQDAFRVIGLLGRENANSLGLMRIALDEVGTASKVSTARMTGVAGATANLKNQLESLGLIIGQVTSGPLEELLNQLAEYVGAAELAATKTIDLGKKIGDIGREVPGGGVAVEVVKKGFKFGNIIGQINTAKNLIQGAFGDAEKEVKTGGDHLSDAIVKAQQQGLGATFGFDKIADSIKKQLALIGDSLNLDLAVAQAHGNQNAELSIQRQIQKRQSDFLEAVLSRPQTAKNIALAKQAAENLTQTNAAIKAITDGRQAAAKQAADAATATAKAEADAAAKTKAANDAAFLAAQEDARGRQQRLVGLAGDTEGLADDIKRQQGLRVLITKQITAIRESALAEDAKRTAIKALAKARQATTDTINQLAATDRQQRQAQKQEAAETLASAQLELAQTTFDLTGAKAPLERAFDAEIKRQIGLKNAAKKGSVAFLEAQTAIRRLLKQKKDLNEEVADAAKEQGLTGGTSLVDLFNENQRIFDQIGNVGQSAAGLTTHAQNASISAIVQHQIQFGGSPAATAQQKATDALTRAIVELTNKLGGGGNFSLGVPLAVDGTSQARGLGHALTEEQRFYFQKQAKAMVEQGLG